MPDETDNAYPEEWSERPEPHPLDPVYGDNLDPWRPTYSELAELAELAQAFVGRDPGAGLQWVHLSRNRDRMPSYLLGLLEIFRAHTVGAAGEALTVERLQSDVLHYRQQHLEGKVNERGD